jgi:Ribbon-helix-helix protein, copG family
MPLKRTNVYADSEDLALIKEIAARRGVPEAQIIREGIHLAAMSNRVWDGSFDWPTFEGSGDPATSDEVTEAVAQAAARRRSRSLTPPASSPRPTATPASPQHAGRSCRKPAR